MLLTHADSLVMKNLLTTLKEHDDHLITLSLKGKLTFLEERKRSKKMILDLQEGNDPGRQVEEVVKQQPHQ